MSQRNDADEEREVIWDEGMPQESVEIVRKGDRNWDIGKKRQCGNCDKCKCDKGETNWGL